MNYNEQIDQLLNKIRDNNNELISQLRTMKEGDQVYYSAKISDLMERTSKTVSEIKSGAVNSAKNNI